MMTSDLVEIIDGRVLADSRKVAERFEKQHKNVLQGIDRLLAEAPALRGLNFQPTFFDVVGPNGAVRQQRRFDMDQKGFSLLVMRFTGATALKWQIAFIDAFEAMKAMLMELLSRPATPEVVAQETVDLEARFPDLLAIERRRMLHAENKRVEKHYGAKVSKRHWEEWGGWHVESDQVVLAAGAGVEASVCGWFNECVERVSGAQTQAKFLIESYVAWCTANELNPISPRSMSDEFERLGVPKKKSNGVMRQGVRLRTAGETAD